MNESKASRYQRLRRRTRAAAVVSGGVMLAILALTPASASLAAWARSVGRAWPGPLTAIVAMTAFVLSALALWELIAVPAVLYLLVVDRRFKRADATVWTALGVHARATLVAIAGALVAATVVELSLWAAGSYWWVAAAVILAGVQTAALAAAPALLAAGGSSVPVTRARLRAQLDRLAERASVEVAGIDEYQSGSASAATAFVSGVGRTRRVFVSAELIREWSDEEIAVVVAHELAHHANRDLWRSLGLDAVVLGLALGAASAVVSGWETAPGAGKPGLEMLPLIALVAGGVWILATPLRHAQSRAHERRADRFALELTGGAEAFSTAIRRLGARHLAEERPSRLTRWLYYRHPSVAERLAVAQSFRRD